MPLVFANRIPRHSKALHKMVDFLNKHHYVRHKIPIYVYNTPLLSDEVIDQYEENPPIEYADYFGLYIPEFGHILLAVGDIEATLAQAILAHEYRHVLQHLHGETYKEAIADSFALYCTLSVQTNEAYL